MMVKFVKTYVDVVVKMRTDGTMIPLQVLWDDRSFEIHRVVRITNKSPANVPGAGTIEYLCIIGGREKKLYLEDYPRRWFVERPVIQFNY